MWVAPVGTEGEREKADDGVGADLCERGHGDRGMQLGQREHLCCNLIVAILPCLDDPHPARERPQRHGNVELQTIPRQHRTDPTDPNTQKEEEEGVRGQLYYRLGVAPAKPDPKIS